MNTHLLIEGNAGIGKTLPAVVIGVLLAVDGNIISIIVLNY